MKKNDCITYSDLRKFVETSIMVVLSLVVIVIGLCVAHHSWTLDGQESEYHKLRSAVSKDCNNLEKVTSASDFDAGLYHGCRDAYYDMGANQ